MADDLTSLRARIERFPKTVTEKLRAVAWRTSRQVKELGRLRAPRSKGQRSRLNEGHPHLGDSIVIIEHADKKEFLVRPETPWNPNLGDWIEHGTRFMSARPFMRPAGDAVEDSYRREMEAAATDTADSLGKG